MSGSGSLIHVAFLLPTFDVGGAEHVALRTAARLDRSRFLPTVIGIIAGSGNLAPDLVAAGIPGVVVDDGTRPRLRQVHRLRRWLRGHPQHILFTFMFHANMIGRLMRRLGVVPAVVSGERAAGLDAPWRVVVDRCTTGWCDAIVVNSEDGRRFWAEQLRLPEDRFTVIYNGVDTAVFAPAAERAGPRLGVLARLHRVNGHDWLLDALARLDAIAPEPWTCVFAGMGTAESELRAKMSRLRLERRVEFAGHVADPAAFLRTLMVCVHPSLFSGMPNAVLEAMACGLPVVATAVGGTPEAIEHETSGWLVRPGDVEGTATLLARLIRTSELRASAGAAARERIVREFSLQRMVAATEDLVARILSLQPEA